MLFPQAARTVATETNVAVGIADAAFVAADTKRVALWLPGSTVASVTYSTLGAAVLGQGIVIPVNQDGIWITFETHGVLVQKAWRSISSGAIAGGLNTITVTRSE